jgi:hypothetical protein
MHLTLEYRLETLDLARAAAAIQSRGVDGQTRDRRTRDRIFVGYILGVITLILPWSSVAFCPAATSGSLLAVVVVATPAHRCKA